jgi:hypothetical protein
MLYRYSFFIHECIQCVIDSHGINYGFNDEQCTAIVLNSIHNEKNWNDVPCVAMGIHYFLCEKVNNKTGTNITMFLPVARQHAGKYPYVVYGV